MNFNEPNKYNWTAIIILWLMMLILAITSPGCSGKKGYEKYKKTNPLKFAADCAKVFPASTKYLPGKTDTIPGDTVFVKGDSIKCPDGNYVKPKDKSVICPPSFTRVDTIQVTDSASLYVLYANVNRLKIDSINKAITIINQDKQIKQLKKQKIVITISGAMLFLLSAFLVFRRFFN